MEKGCARQNPPGSQKRAAEPRSLGLGVGGDEVDGEIDGADLVGIAVGDLEPEFLFQGHHHLYGVQAVEAQVVAEAGIWGDLHMAHHSMISEL